MKAALSALVKAGATGVAEISTILDERFKHHLFLSSPGGAGRNRVLNIPQMANAIETLDRVSRDLKVAQIETEEMYMDSRDETEPDKE